MQRIALFILLTISQTAFSLTLTSGRGEITIVREDRAQTIDTSEMNSPVILTSSTLIITGLNTFARIANESGDIIIVGPESKVTVETAKALEGNFLSLHSGLVRIIAKKQRRVEKGRFDRVFLRTNSGVVGIEDGDALVTYNVLNNVTGVLAFRGLGHVKSIDKTSRFSANQRLMFRRGRNGKELKFQFRKNSDFLELTSDVNKSLFSQNSRGVSIVERGQYSATFHESRPVSMPVKINPIQFTLLYRNTYLDMTLYSKDSSSSDLESTRATYPLVGDILAPKDQAASYRGQYSLAQRKYAPKAGGLVDLRTGIYVPPEANAIFNEIYKVYVPKGVGRLNAVNGNYVPIKNLKLDANRGFVVENHTHDSIRKQSALNNLLKSNLLLASYKNVQNKKMSTAEQFSANIVGLSLVNQSYSHAYDQGTFELSKRGIELSLVLIGNGSFRPFANFRLLNENFSEPTLNSEVERFYQMDIGFDYQFSPYFYVGAKLAIEEEPIVLNATNTITSATLANLASEVGLKLMNLKRFDLFASLKVMYNMANEDDLYDVSSGMGYSFGMNAKYWTNRRSFVYGEFSYLTHGYDITGNSNDSAVDMSGTVLNIGYRYSF